MNNSLCFTDTEFGSGNYNENYVKEEELVYKLNQLADILVKKYLQTRRK